MRNRSAMTFGVLPVLLALLMASFVHILEAHVCACRGQSAPGHALESPACCTFAGVSAEAENQFEHCECCSQPQPDSKESEPLAVQLRTPDDGHEPRGPAVSMAVFYHAPPHAITRDFTAARLPHVASHVSTTVLRL